MEYASNAKGNLGVTLGAIGTGLGVLNGGVGLLGMGGNGIMCQNTSRYVTKDELTMSQEIASKDSRIAFLEAESDSEKKMIEVYRQSHAELVTLRDNVNADIKELRNEVNTNRREQDAWNASQSVANAQMSAAIAVNANSIADLKNCCNSITQIKIPNSAVCPGWGNITVTPDIPTP